MATLSQNKQAEYGTNLILLIRKTMKQEICRKCYPLNGTNCNYDEECECECHKEKPAE